MEFWYRKILKGSGRQRYGEQRAVRLPEGCVWVWPQGDDHANKHGVWFPKGAAREGERLSFVFRWSTRVREFSPEYPHRIVLSEAEREYARWVARRAELRRARRLVRRARTHAMETRSSRAHATETQSSRAHAMETRSSRAAPVQT